MKQRLFQVIAGVMLLCFCISGCGNAGQTLSDHAADSKPAEQREVIDDLGRHIVLAEPPRRVVVLSTSLLNLAAVVEGDIVGRAAVKAEDAELPSQYEHVPDVGPVYNISLEKIVSLSPDLVIASATQHQKLISRLEQMNIPVIALKSKTYDDVKRNIVVLGQVYRKAELSAAAVSAMDQRMQDITSRLPSEHKRAAIIHATPSSVTVQLPSSIAGSIADMLGLENVAAGDAVDGAVEKIPYSMEALVEKDPDIIFFTSMGPAEKIESRIQQDVKNNPAWAALGAVQRGNVYVLPERYFLLSPGLKYPEAAAYMAKLAYPEVFHE